MANTDNVKLNGFECFWCKSTHLNKVSDDKYKCKSCGSINYKLTDSDNVKFILASTYMASYKYDDADKLYKELSESENYKTKIQALYGRLLAFFGVTYIKDFNGSLVVTFSNYKPEYSSITECSYYKDIINSEYKDTYLDKLNELDNEYNKIRVELNKGIKYDIFICTKISLKTKDNPVTKGYTDDSKYAESLYEELINKGLEVFYSDKLLSGIDYDAQIYSALLRSKKIIVISSSKEYLESPWVQSEWERWINFIKEDVKDKNSLYLFVPNNAKIDLPRKLEKTQRFTNPIELVSRLTDNKKVKRNINTIDDLLKEASYNLDIFELTKAEEIYFEIAHNYPEDYRGWLGLVDILIEKEVSENDKRYQKWFDKAISLADEKNKQLIINKYKKNKEKATDNAQIDDRELDLFNNSKESKELLIEDLLKEAKYKIDMFELDAAEEIYKQITRNYPEDYRGWLGLVDILKEKEVPSEDKRYQKWLENAISFADEENKKLIINDFKKEELEKEEKLKEQKLEELMINFKVKKELGRYPQTLVTDTNITNELNKIIKLNKLGYIEYNGNEYKELNGNYYLVEPIKWKILESNNNTYKLVSDVILDSSVFYVDYKNNRTINNNTIYPNNYEYSNIRAWLNGYDGTSYKVDNYTGKGFIDIAFTEEERKLINETLVDNSSSTTDSTTKFTDNPYVCNNTIDKIYLLSYKDISKKYFKTKEERKAKPTDYAKARGVYESSDGYGCFWLRSPYHGLSYHAYYIISFGDFIHDTVIYSENGVRPALEITIK